MIFSEKYTTDSLKLLNAATEKDKLVISNDAYALGEIIEELKNKIEHVRLTWSGR